MREKIGRKLGSTEQKIRELIFGSACVLNGRTNFEEIQKICPTRPWLFMKEI
jgi:hypothetical protein